MRTDPTIDDRNPPEPYETPTYWMGAARVPDLDEALALAATLEDEEIARKIAARK